jgi:hypothetical protein
MLQNVADAEWLSGAGSASRDNRRMAPRAANPGAPERRKKIGRTISRPAGGKKTF